MPQEKECPQTVVYRSAKGYTFHCPYKHKHQADGECATKGEIDHLRCRTDAAPGKRVGGHETQPHPAHTFQNRDGCLHRCRIRYNTCDRTERLLNDEFCINWENDCALILSEEQSADCQLPAS